jgi:hypothetical protein
MLVDYLTLLTFAAGALVLLAHANALNQNLARFWECFYDFAALPLLGTREDNNGISFFYVKGVHISYTTSGAREMIVW